MIRKLLHSILNRSAEHKSQQLRDRLEFAVQQNLGPREERANRHP